MQPPDNPEEARWRAALRDQTAVLALLSLVVGLVIYAWTVQLLFTQLFAALLALLLYLVFLRRSGQEAVLPGLTVSFRLSGKQRDKLRLLAAVVDFWILAYVGILGPLHNQLLLR